VALKELKRDRSAF